MVLILFIAMVDILFFAMVDIVLLQWLVLFIAKVDIVYCNGCYCCWWTEFEEDLDAAVRTIKESQEDGDAAVSCLLF